ncbi:hypothetical protein C8Q79DRAFT_1002500 [Trametes meyenii]|nr:hypothetical protein C8Q79DRAFT_1002500 [Trametes meyenii]
MSAQHGPWCDGLGGGAFDGVHNFTLAAWNTSLPNANNTGAPLVLATAGAIPGAELRQLATYASFPFDDYPTFSLVNGTLIPQGGSTPAQATIVQDGSSLGFLQTVSAEPTKGSQIYCAVADLDPAGHGTGHPFLAVNGDTDSFSLCQTGAQNVVFYKPAAEGREDFASCYPVKVQLILPQ